MVAAGPVAQGVVLSEAAAGLVPLAVAAAGAARRRAAVDANGAVVGGYSSWECLPGRVAHDHGSNPSRSSENTPRFLPPSQKRGPATQSTAKAHWYLLAPPYPLFPTEQSSRRLTRKMLEVGMQEKVWGFVGPGMLYKILCLCIVRIQAIRVSLAPYTYYFLSCFVHMKPP